MLARAVEKYVRMSPRKVRYVIEPLRHRRVSDALDVLASTNRRASKPIAKAIASAFANAKQKDPTLVEDQVVIQRLFADGGPMWKRHRAAAFGRAVMILKRTTHITVELERAVGLGPTVTPAPAERTEERSQTTRRRKVAAMAGRAKKAAPKKAAAGKTKTVRRKGS